MAEGKYEQVGKRVGALVDEKNKAYGSSFDKTGDFLRLLWPNGCPPERFGDLLAMARVFDKMMRIATDKDAFGESPWQDIVGYGLLSLVKAELEKEERLTKQQPEEPKKPTMGEELKIMEVPVPTFDLKPVSKPRGNHTILVNDVPQDRFPALDPSEIDPEKNYDSDGYTIPGRYLPWTGKLRGNF